MTYTVTVRDSADQLRHLGFVVDGDRKPPAWKPPVAFVKDIQELVAAYYHIPTAEMTSQARCREYARPRQVAMYLCREITERSLPDIGRRFGNRDHTTVIHSCRQIERLRQSDPEIRHDVAKLTSMIAGRP